MDEEAVKALCAAALALGIDSLRASVFAVRVARAAAALAGSPSVEEEHIGVAARLVLAPRATRLPPPTPQEDQTEDTPEATENSENPPPEPQAASDRPETENQDQNKQKKTPKTTSTKRLACPTIWPSWCSKQLKPPFQRGSWPV
jgi:magnesium chelatase subunit D